MKRHVVLAALAATLAAGSAIAETAPTDVMFEEGAVAQSLTGAPGNPEAGAEVASTRALGNCVACHVVSALKIGRAHV